MKKKLYLLILFVAPFMLSLKAQNQRSCNAAFTYTINQNMVSFSPVDSFAQQGEWIFGDGNSSWGLYVTNSYAASGTYKVTHIVSDSAICSDTSLQTITVNFTISCLVDITYSIDSGSLNSPSFNNQYIFTAQPSVIGSTVKNYSWTIDSTISTDSTNNSFRYKFLHLGTHHVCVQLQTYSGCVATKCIDIPVKNIDSCTASYTYTVSPENPLLVTFKPSPDSSNYKYQWYFNGVEDTASHPVHLFSKGVSEIYLVISKYDSAVNVCSASAAGSISVGLGPADTCSLNFSYTINPSMPNQVSFIAQGGQPLVSQDWTIIALPDSTGITLQSNNPVYNFTDTGYYLIKLKAVTQAGCIDSVLQEILIDSFPRNATASNQSQLLNAYPNPASNQVSININLPENTSVMVNIFSVSGNIVATKKLEGFAGANIISMPVQNLQSGIYYIEIKYGNETKRSRFQKM